VIADDGNIVVLGGLIDEQVTENVSAVPLLSKLPLLGELFTYRERNKKKTNLMVFLRPVIVRSAEDMLTFTQDRYEYMRFHEQKSAMDRQLFLPRYAPPVLPEYSQPPPKPAPAPKEERAAPPQAPPAPSAAVPPASNNVPIPVEILPGTPPDAPPSSSAAPPVTAPPPGPAATAPAVSPATPAAPPAGTITPPPLPPGPAAPAAP
jgi:hypothetical protein